jgi:hypothetical protein
MSAIETPSEIIQKLLTLIHDYNTSISLLITCKNFYIYYQNKFYNEVSIKKVLWNKTIDVLQDGKNIGYLKALYFFRSKLSMSCSLNREGTNFQDFKNTRCGLSIELSSDKKTNNAYLDIYAFKITWQDRLICDSYSEYRRIIEILKKQIRYVYNKKYKNYVYNIHYD